MRGILGLLGCSGCVAIGLVIAPLAGSALATDGPGRLLAVPGSSLPHPGATSTVAASRAPAGGSVTTASGTVVFDPGTFRLNPNDPNNIETTAGSVFSSLLDSAAFIGDDLTLSGSGVLSELSFTVANFGFLQENKGAVDGIDYEIYFQLPVDPNLVTGSESNYPVEVFPIPGPASLTGTLDLSNPDGNLETEQDNPINYLEIRQFTLSGLESSNITLPKEVRVIILFRDVRINGSSAELIQLGSALQQPRAEVGYTNDFFFFDSTFNSLGYLLRQRNDRINASPWVKISVVEVLEENNAVPRLAYHAVLGERSTEEGDSLLFGRSYDPFTELSGNEFETDVFGPITYFRYAFANQSGDPNDPGNPTKEFGVNSWSQTFWIFDRQPDPNNPGEELWVMVDRFTHHYDWTAVVGTPLPATRFTVNQEVRNPVSDIDPNRPPETVGTSVGIMQGFVWDFVDKSTIPISTAPPSAPIEFFRSGLVFWQDLRFGSNDVGTSDPTFYTMQLDTSDPNLSQVNPNNDVGDIVTAIQQRFFIDPNDPDDPNDPFQDPNDPNLQPSPLVPHQPLMAVVVVPVVQPTFELGDLDCSGNVDASDISPFINALLNPTRYATRFPDCDWNLADINGSGTVDAGDISPFVRCILNGGCP